VVRRLLPRQLRKDYGISAVECVGAEKLRASLDAGHGIMIVPNHCRPCDPMVLDFLAAEVRRPFHVIASWHVFMTNWFQRMLVPRMGGFSVYREGTDRESLKCAFNLVADGKYLVQQLHCYTGNYLQDPTPERILETVERYEEDLTDIARPHFPLRVVISVGEAIEVDAARDHAHGVDPVTEAIREQLEGMLESTKALRNVAATGTVIP
jgi:hypothetical protein